VDTKETNVFFLNQGGKLNNVSRDSGLDLRGNSRSAAYLDYDGDGDLDIVLNNYHEAAKVYRNDSVTEGTAWLKVKLVGDPAAGVNRDAIGASIVVRAGDNTIWREIRGSSGYMTVQSKQQHFGLAGSEVIELDLLWPNGRKESFSNVKAGQSLVITYRAETSNLQLAK
jgi:hypothetical protein